MQLLIVKLSSLGDVVQTAAVVQDVLTRFPDAQIDWVVEEAFAPLLSLVAGVRRVYLAGAPGEHRDRLEEAGVDEFVHVGVDALDVLRRAQHECGVGTGGAR